MSEATLAEFKCRYRHAVFTTQRLLSMADEARVSGMQEAHDHLVDAANEYKKVFVTIREEACKAFPEEAARALSFDLDTTSTTPDEEPTA